MTAEYNLHQVREAFGPIELTIECLADFNQTVDDLFKDFILDETPENGRRLEDLCPYFATIWPAAQALVQALVTQSDKFKGQSFLELGCGLAIPSLVASKLGGVVTATDFHPDVPAFLTRNMALNQVSDLAYHHVDWTHGFAVSKPFDWVVASDVLYERQHAKILARVIAQSLAQTGTALIADPGRPYLQEFVDEMVALGFICKTDIKAIVHKEKAQDIYLLCFTR